jgi:hypothetical protein
MKPMNEARFWNVFVVTWLIFVAVCFFTLLAGCGYQPVCTSRCGVELLNTQPQPGYEPFEWTCENFQRVEDEAEIEFAKALDPRVQNYCENIRGWRVSVDERLFWQQNGTGVQVFGETSCFYAVMYVNNAPPGRSSLPHEMAHALQACVSTGGWGENGHNLWAEEGIFAAIGNVWSLEYDRMLDAGYQP